MEIVRSETDLLYRKIAWKLIPFLLLCYAVAIIDRFNIGFAKLQFLQELKMDNAVFGLAAGFFSVGYVASEVPSNLLLDRIGIRKTLLRIMVLWGFVTFALAFCRTEYQLYIVRFLLGAAEGGFFPGILFYLTLWFPDRLRGRMTSLFVMAVPLGGIIAGPISGIIMDDMHGLGGLSGWQWLFMVEGIPAIVLGIIAYFYLPDRPTGANWLTSHEKMIVEKELAADRAAAVGKNASKDFSAALRDPKVYVFAIVYFAFFCSLNTLLLWSPSLLKSVGVKSTTEIGFLSGLISILSAIGMVVVGYSSDRLLERRWHVATCGLVASACFMFLTLAVKSVFATVALLTIASVGIFSILSLFWTIPSAYLEGSAAAGGIALISAIGSFGGAVCPAIVGWVTVATGNLYTALGLVGALHAAGMILLLIATRFLAQRNAVAVTAPI